jgi:hypothetical protein
VAEDHALHDSLMRLAAIPADPHLSRDHWVEKFSRIRLQGIVAVSPESQTYSLDANWNLLRIGSFWREDEEHHVYGMEHAVVTMLEHKRQNPNVLMNIVTPVFVFIRSGNGAAHVNGDDVLKTAGRNFMRYFDEFFKRWNHNG